LYSLFLFQHRLEDESEDTEQQRQTVEHVVSLVFFELVGEFGLVAQTQVVDKRNTCYPVAVFQFAVSLYLILSSCEVPHKVSPVHEVTLIGEEESQVFQLCRHLHRYGIAVTPVVHHGRTFDAAHPSLVRAGMSCIPHTREEHVLGIFVFVIGAHYEV